LRKVRNAFVAARRIRRRGYIFLKQIVEDFLFYGKENAGLELR
jgi:hypothetical protein